jgi:hypothetical protein
MTSTLPRAAAHAPTRPRLRLLASSRPPVTGGAPARVPFLRPFVRETAAWTTAVVTAAYAGMAAHELGRVHGFPLFAVTAAAAVLSGLAVFERRARWARVFVAALWAAAVLTALARHGVAYTVVSAAGAWESAALMVGSGVALTHLWRSTSRRGVAGRRRGGSRRWSR